MTPRFQNPPSRSLTVEGVRLSRNGAFSDATGVAFDSTAGVADYEVHGGGLLTKAPGHGQDIYVTAADGSVSSWRYHRGGFVATTKVTCGHDPRPLPRQRLLDHVLAFAPGTQNAELSFHGGLPWNRGLVRVGKDGTISFLAEATGQSETHPFGEPVPPIEINDPSSSAIWVFTMHRRYAEVRRGDYFDRFWFDQVTRLWMRECQLTRLPLNTPYQGVYFRPSAKIVVPARPHPFVVDGARPFNVLLRDGATLIREDDWWCRVVGSDGHVTEFVYFEKAWRRAEVGVTGYHVQGVLTSETQMEASCQGVLTVHRDGTFRIPGCGLVFRDSDAVDVSTPDLVAQKPAGSGEWLIISDGDTSLIARYQGSVLAGQEQWWVGGQTQTPSAHESATPYLLVIAAIGVWVLVIHGQEVGLVELGRDTLVFTWTAATLWVGWQCVRAVFASLGYLRSLLHTQVF